jgi:hypothetical protein
MPGALRAQEEVLRETVEERQRGDIKLTAEMIQFDPIAVQGLVTQTKATFRTRNPDFPTALLGAAQSLVGINRSSDAAKVSEFLELFNLPFAIDGKPLPFCAAGLSFAAATAYANFWGTQLTDVSRLSVLRGALSEIDRYHFYPTPSVVDMYYVARGKRRWVDRSSGLKPKAGWLVVYDWEKNGGKDHVGIVEEVADNTIHTIEFNTSSKNQGNGGSVAQRERKSDATVSGYIRTDIKTFV